MFRRVKGTQDFLDLTQFLYVVDQARAHFQTYSFIPIQTPIVEHADLFIRSLGEHTDVVMKEMFFVAGKNSTDDQKEQLVLRPEMTASIMRAFLEDEAQQVVRPWRVFTWGPAFRYERPQKGRYRQFHQISIEMIDAASIAYDAELLAMLHTFFMERLALTSVTLDINYLGTPEDRARYKTRLYEYIQSRGDVPKAIFERKDTNILRCFDLKDAESVAFMHEAPRITDYLSAESQKEWQMLQQLLADSYIPFQINPRLVRGLDYYNKTVFEFSSSALGAQSALCGGGRYDTLAQEFGYTKPLPSLGAGIGLERLMLALEAEHAHCKKQYASIVVLPLEERFVPLALLYAEKLRAADVSCEALYDVSSLKSMMRKADKREAKLVIFIGADEQQGNYVTCKDMSTGVVDKVAPADLITFCKKMVF